MANYSTLKTAVADVVKTNGAQAITGANLQSVLLSIINSVGGGGYIFKGVATPSTNAGTPDENVFYIGGAGTYANFGTSVTVPVGSIGVFKYNGSWTKEQIALFAGIDDVPTAGSNNLIISGAVAPLSQSVVGIPTETYEINGWGHYVGSYILKNGVKYTVTINSPTTGITLYTRLVDASHNNLTSTATFSSFPASFSYTPNSDYIGAQLYLGLDGSGTFEISIPTDSLQEEQNKIKEQLILVGGLTKSALNVLLPPTDILFGKLMNASGTVSTNANYNCYFIPVSLINTGRLTIYGPSPSTSNYVINACDANKAFISNIANYPVTTVDILLSNYPTAKYIAVSISNSFTDTSIETNYIGSLRQDINDVREMSFNHHATGNNNAFSIQRINSLLPNSTYRLSFKDNNWDVSGVTGTGANIFRIRNNYNNSYTDLINIVIGSSVEPYYDLTVPANSDFIDVSIRATAGVVVYYDITKLSEGGILDMNGGEKMTNKLSNAARPNRVAGTSTASTPAPLLLAHFSDIHGDSENLKRIVQWTNKFASYLDDVLCTGDVVYNSWADDFTYWGTVGAAKILNCIGNHDTALYSGGTYDWDYYAGLQAYNRYFAPYINSWGVTQPSGAATNGYCYYYKDYTTKKVRLIVLDAMKYDSTQNTWLVSVLNDILSNHSDYSVVIAQHYTGGNTTIDCTFTSYEAPKPQDINAEIITAVDSFISSGGKFVCHLCGHVHIDQVTTLPNNHYQTFIALDAATHQQTWWGDADRVAGTKNQDCMNVVVIDTYAKNVKVVRVGKEWNNQFQHTETLVYHYSEDGSASPVVLTNN